ncbi:MAG: general secretion pathway protein K [Oceanicoccus sp.]|jgi:general secretion pathway protein K
MILALVVVVVVVLLANTVGSDFMVTFKRVENQLHQQQAMAWMRGAEGIARELLQTDYQNDKSVGIAKDHRSEGLNQQVDFPLEQGAIAGTVCDLQARFNVNNLGACASAYNPDQQIFIRLLQALELAQPIDQQQAEDITHAVIDWLDVDGNICRSGGAEQGYYSNAEPPMHTANRSLASSSELRWVKGMTAEIYKALAPHIVALPAPTSLNINTAEVELLMAINETSVLQPIDRIDAESIISVRDGDINGSILNLRQGFDKVTDIVSDHPATAPDISRLSINSEYFMLQTTALFMDREYRLNSVLYRDTGGNIKTVARARNSLGLCRVDPAI